MKDLVHYGLIPEFVGRVPVIATVQSLDENDMVRILIEPRNALIRQYKRLFALDNVELTFTEEALRAGSSRGHPNPRWVRAACAALSKRHFWM